MQGVLRSEVEGHLRSQISAVIRSARVSAVPLLSIGVLGAVTRPGYFWVPVTASVSDAIMVAGGPATDADLKSLVMLRAGKEQWSRATMTAALQRRISLGSLGADDGDVLSLSKAAAPLDRNFLMGALGLALQSVFLFSTLR
jgi:protein involved in polysaccharide export with SLBB domain